MLVKHPHVSNLENPRHSTLRYMCALHKAGEWHFKMKRNEETGVIYYLVALRCGCSFVRAGGDEWHPWTYGCVRLNTRPEAYSNMLKTRQPILVDTEINDCNVGSVQPEEPK